MATLSLNVTPTSAAPGDTVTATYTLSGADTVDHAVQVDGDGTFDGVPMHVTGGFTLSHVRSFQPPTAPGMTFVATSDPKVFTATVPAS